MPLTMSFERLSKFMSDDIQQARIRVAYVKSALKAAIQSETGPLGVPHHSAELQKVLDSGCPGCRRMGIGIGTANVIAMILCSEEIGLIEKGTEPVNEKMEGLLMTIDQHDIESFSEKYSEMMGAMMTRVLGERELVKFTTFLHDAEIVEIKGMLDRISSAGASYSN